MSANPNTVTEDVLIAVTTDLHASSISDENSRMQEQLVDAIATVKNLLSLNDDCLIKIFENLQSIDWIHLSLANERFHHIIKHNIISRFYLDFGKIREKVSVCKVFKLFKNYIVKMGITLDDIQYEGNASTNSNAVLEIMKQYCSVDKLKELSLCVYLYGIKPELLEEFASILRNIQVFKFSGNSSINSVNVLISQMDNLKELNLINVILEPLNTVVKFRNLEQLLVQRCTISDAETLNKIVANNSKLKTLKYLGNLCIYTNTEHSIEFLRFSLNLEEFSLDFLKFYPIDIASYSNILNLNKLKTLRIISETYDCSDIYSFLETLARKNSVENLVIEIKCDLQCAWLPSPHSNYFEYFQSLKTLEIINSNHWSESFLTDFTQALPNLRNLVLRSEKNCSHSQSLIINLVTNIKNLTQLTLYAKQFNITETFYRILWHAKFLTGDGFCLELRVSEAQKRKFFDLKCVYDEKVVKIASY